MTQEPLKLEFLGALVEQLGAQLYPSATATVAELISNAWDADARNVWITIPFGESWTEDSEIIVLDDGHGMTRQEAQNKYLIAGRKRRLTDGGKTPHGRQVHGRKGIGKFAAFGTAEVLDCYTVTNKRPVSFRLDYNGIRKTAVGSDYIVEEGLDNKPLLNPDKSRLNSGTRIRLSQLRLKRAISRDQFMRSMSRRFAVDGSEMKVFINDHQLERFDMDLEFRFPKDGAPDKYDITIETDGWGTESIERGKKIRWWIGFTPKPLQADYLRGVSILSRGKMVQRPFMFEKSQGARGQLGQEYIVGEVSADWLDTGVDIDDDLIQTNRDQLQLEDSRVQELLNWGKRRLNWALSQRLNKRQDKIIEGMEDPDISDLLQDFTATEQLVLIDIAKKAAEIGDPDPEAIHDFMKEIINGYKDRAVRELMDRVKAEDDNFQTNFWGLVREFSLIDARRNLTIIQARLSTIERLDAAINSGATEVPIVHDIIKEFPWLLDPRWSLLGDEVNLDSLTEAHEPKIDDETGDVLDFLFVLQPKQPASLDQLLVVEIKRGYKSNGKIHSVSDTEVNKFHSYVLGVRDHYSANTVRPSVSGLMIANRYSIRADRIRRSLERLQDIKLEFQTWGTVIEHSRLLHTSWLEVSRAKSVGQREQTQSNKP